MAFLPEAVHRLLIAAGVVHQSSYISGQSRQRSLAYAARRLAGVAIAQKAQVHWKRLFDQLWANEVAVTVKASIVKKASISGAPMPVDEKSYPIPLLSG